MTVGQRIVVLVTAVLALEAAALGEPAPAPVTLRLERVIERPADLSASQRLWRRVTGTRDEKLFIRPYAVAWDGDAIVVTDAGDGRVVRIEASGRILSKSGDEGSEPVGVAVCNGRIFVTDSRRGRIEELSRNLRHVAWLAEELDRPTGIVCRNDLVIFAETGAHRIVVIAPDKRTTIGSRGGAVGEFNFPTSLALGGRSLFIGDAMNFRIQRYDLETGAFAAAFGGLGDNRGDLPRIKGVASDPAGDVWVTDAYLDEIAAYSPDGRYLASVGGSGSESGQFAFPAGLAFGPDGRLAVVDSINRRVQIFVLTAAGEKR